MFDILGGKLPACPNNHSVFNDDSRRSVTPQESYQYSQIVVHTLMAQSGSVGSLRGDNSATPPTGSSWRLRARGEYAAASKTSQIAYEPSDAFQQQGGHRSANCQSEPSAPPQVDRLPAAARLAPTANRPSATASFARRPRRFAGRGAVVRRVPGEHGGDDRRFRSRALEEGPRRVGTHRPGPRGRLVPPHPVLDSRLSLRESSASAMSGMALSTGSHNPPDPAEPVASAAPLTEGGPDATFAERKATIGSGGRPGAAADGLLAVVLVGVASGSCGKQETES